MASEAQVLANRRNAQRSTGPRTTEGKAVVSQNAVKHGLTGREAVVRGENPGEFEFYRDRMLGELGPVGPMESVLAERVVSLSWRLQRAERLQNEAFEDLYAREAESPFSKARAMTELSRAILSSGGWSCGTSPTPGSWPGCWCTSGGSSTASTRPWPSCRSNGLCASRARAWRNPFVVCP
jgi:hypothetical protein